MPRPSLGVQVPVSVGRMTWHRLSIGLTPIWQRPLFRIRNVRLLRRSKFSLPGPRVVGNVLGRLQGPRLGPYNWALLPVKAIRPTSLTTGECPRGVTGLVFLGLMVVSDVSRVTPRVILTRQIKFLPSLFRVNVLMFLINLLASRAVTIVTTVIFRGGINNVMIPRIVSVAFRQFSSPLPCVRVLVLVADIVINVTLPRSPPSRRLNRKIYSVY